MRKIKIWGGVHVDEVEALKCVDSLIKNPLPDVDADIADPYNRRLGRRTKLCCALSGALRSDEHLNGVAAEMIIQSQGYYGNIDKHNINCFGGNTAHIAPSRGVSPVMLGMVGKLGIKNLVAFEHGLPKAVRNTFVLETLASGLGSDHKTLRDAFDNLANDPDPPIARAVDFHWFRFLGGLHVKQVTPEVLTPAMRNDLQAFDILRPDVSAQMGFGDIPVCLVSWRYEARKTGYWGEVATPIPKPDDSLWPR